MIERIAPLQDLRHLTFLRLLVVAGPIMMLLWLHFGLAQPQSLPVWVMGLFFGLITLVFIGLYLQTRLADSISAWELFAYLQFDVLALAGLLYFSGGASNPFISLLLLPLIITATLLPTACVWAMTGVAVAVYTSLMFHYLPLPGMLSGHGPGFHAHLWGCLLYTSPSPRDRTRSRMPSSA